MTPTLKLLAFAAVVGGSGCALPERPLETEALPLPQVSPGELERSARALAAGHGGETGVATLAESLGAFAARAALIDAAERSVDAQYYIWRDDLTGNILLDSLRRAADRGVRVRLLLDDNGIDGLDPQLAQLDAHPNAAVRLFNPFVLRKPKWLNYAFDFFRLNRRMHNKSLTVDGTATIVGGRNVGDEYFGTGDAALFVDVDVLAIGRVVEEVEADFERYWRSKSAYPAGVILPAFKGGDPLGEKAAEVLAAPEAQEYREALQSSSLVGRLREGTLEFEWTNVRLVSDDPAKGLGMAGPDGLMIARLEDAVGRPVERLDLVSAYFVPGERGTAWLNALEDEGVEVRALTNALEATDVVPVHAGYAKRRKTLLKGGVELYELKREAPGAVEPGEARMLGPFGSSGASLHAKTFAIDGRSIYIGSFNFDPRSKRLNTEMGFVIDSPGMANRLHGAFERYIPEIAYQPLLRDGSIVWKDGDDVLKDEPGASLGKRALLKIVTWLPVEWLL